MKSPDSDIFYILLHYAASMEPITILFDTGTGNKKKLINITELAQGYTPEHCTALLALHAFSGCDCTSAFRGLGKVKPIKTLLKTPRYVRLLSKLGDSWDVSDDLIEGLDAFTCAIYGRPRVSKVDDLRLIRMNELCSKDDIITPSKNVDMATLPPCRRSLVQHIKRVNYQVAIWKRAHVPEPDLPGATMGHGWTLVDGILEPLWYEGEILPQQLTDIANPRHSEASDDEGDDDSEDDDDDAPAPGLVLDSEESDSDMD